MNRSTIENEYVLHRFKAVYEDGAIKEVLGRYGPHAWFVASNLRPGSPVVSLERIAS